MDELIQKIESSYGLSVKDVVLIRSSDDNDTYKIVADRGIFFGRLSKRKNKDSLSIDSELAFIKHLNSNSIPVAGVIPSKDGKDFTYMEGTPLVIFEWIDGVVGCVSKGKYLPSEKAYNAGRTLAALHNASVKYPNECILDRKLTTEMKRIEDFREEVLKRYTDGKEFMKTIARLIEFAEKYSAQKHIIIHNDFRPQNVLFGLNGERENIVVGIVDFDWMCLAPPIKDLALALVEWSFADGDVSADLESLRAFLSGYVQDIDAKYIPTAQDVAQWIEYACLSDVATYISDTITYEESQEISGATEAKELRSYMLSKAKYFRSMDFEEIFRDIHQ